MPVRTPPPRADGAAPAGATRLAPPPRSPQAARLPRPRWLDLRLLVGVGLVLGSVLLGARLVGSADDTVPVWAARTALAPGQQLSATALEPRQVRLDDGLEAYLSADAAAPAGWLVTRPVAAGELLPRAAVRAAGTAEVRHVTVAVPRDELPASLAAGSRVEVWSAPPSQQRAGTAGQAARGDARRLLGPTAVQAVVDAGSTFGSASGTVPVVLAVEAPARAGSEGLDRVVAGVLGASRSGELYLVGLPAPAAP